MERILGIDFGDRRVGVAISDDLGFFASPLTVIENLGDEEVLNRITDITEEWEIYEIIVGFPINLDGSEGARCQRTREIVEKMQERYADIRIVQWDERLSTVEAEKKIIEAGLKRKKKKEKIDALAAQVILQRYLNYRYNQNSEDSEDLDQGF